MKTSRTLLLIGAVLALSSCANMPDFKVDFEGSVGSKPAEPQQVSCVAIDYDKLDEAGPIENALEIWGQRSKFWEKDQVIRVRFLDGTKRQISETKARLDRLDSLSGVTLQYVASGPSEWRVSFRQRNQHWAYLGKDALYIPQNQPTINIGLGWAWFNDTSKEWNRVVLHEGLHALGFDHEQAHPSANIDWNRDVVYREYAIEQGWSRKQVDQQVLNRYRGTEFVGTAYTPTSIMNYPIPKKHLRSGDGVGWNTDLDPVDIAGLQAQYPLN